MTITLAVEHTWDGEPLRPAETCTVTVESAGEELLLTVDAPWHGDPAPEGPVGPTWQLWEHEVVELFVAGEGDAYTEIELGPHGHHLVLRFREVRRAWARELPLDYRAERRGDRWHGTARVPRSYLPPGPHRWNAYAIHGQGPDRRYLACYPPGGEKPDFHRLACFR